MQTTKIIQAVILMILVAIAASCTYGKEYSKRVFGQHAVAKKDSSHTIRFLDHEAPSDTIPPINTAALTKSDSNSNAHTVIIPSKPIQPIAEPVVKNAMPNGVRTKRTRNQP